MSNVFFFLYLQIDLTLKDITDTPSRQAKTISAQKFHIAFLKTIKIIAGDNDWQEDTIISRQAKKLYTKMLCWKACRTRRVLFQDEVTGFNFLHSFVPSRWLVSEDLY